jgi:hypothetical protein
MERLGESLGTAPMNTSGKGEHWTGRQLAAHLATLNGVAPDPVAYAVCRMTTQADASETATYQVSDEPHALTGPELAAWMARRHMAGPQLLGLSVLVIREVVDHAGLIRECILERRRGGVDGPLYGQPARIEFTGPARMVRFYRVQRDGRLTEVAGSSDGLPPRHHAPEQFAGEHKAVRERYGAAARVIDAREPTLFEEMVGLNGIVHVRLPDGRELGCGIGWHGPIPFILEADFPRFSAPLALPPEDEAAIEAMLTQHDLVRHETRLDEHGLVVLARRRGAPALFLLRAKDGVATISPYEAGRSAQATEDQARWMRYAETYENLAILDSWRDGNSSDLIVLTGEASGQVWRHHIDSDGVETWRKPDDDAAVAAVHGDRLFPGTLVAADAPGLADASEAAADRDEADEANPAAPDSLLGKAEAYVDALTALLGAREIAAALPREPGAALPAAALQHLRDLQPALDTLAAEHAASETRILLAQAEDGLVRPDRFARTLARIEARLLDELAALRLVALPPGQWRYLIDPSPFGRGVESEFPDAAYDIEEAALCLAFRRPTAAAFHCMRIIEYGLQTLAARLRLDGLGADRRWGPLLLRLRNAAGPELTAPLVALDQVRRSWRGAQLLPVEKYTEGEAERLFLAVGAFMREVSAACRAAA